VQVTEVRIKLMDESCQFGNERLRAFCSVTFDNAFVVRDLRIIEGAKGFFVAMPSRKLTDRCPRCSHKNPLTARYCSNCGRRLPENRALRDEQGYLRLHQDIAHPINQECRDRIQQAVIQAFLEELERAKQPGYISRYDEPYESGPSSASSPQRPRPPAPSYRSASRPGTDPSRPSARRAESA
jgi:stage V sporulation protein G